MAFEIGEIDGKIGAIIIRSACSLCDMSVVFIAYSGNLQSFVDVLRSTVL